MSHEVSLKLPSTANHANNARRSKSYSLKRILKLDRLRLRGLTGARDEFLLAATAQNLRRMTKLLGQPPPGRRIDAPA